MKNEAVKNFFRVFKCPVCREPIELGTEELHAMCRICRTKWTVEKGRPCIQCGLGASECRCMPEHMSKAKVDDLIKLCFYDPESGSAADRFVLYMKDYRDMRVFDFAVSEMYSNLDKYFAEKSLDPHELVFTYAPRSRATRDRRGFDQAEILSRRIARRFGAVFMKTVSRKYFSRRQKGLDADARLENAKNSFCTKRDLSLKGKIVVLIDDVVTTGSSLSACARLIRRAGATQIVCAAIAYTDIRR